MTIESFVEALRSNEPPIRAEVRGNLARVPTDPVPREIGDAEKLANIVYQYAGLHNVTMDHSDPEQSFWKNN